MFAGGKRKKKKSAYNVDSPWRRIWQRCELRLYVHLCADEVLGVVLAASPGCKTSLDVLSLRENMDTGNLHS